MLRITGHVLLSLAVCAAVSSISARSEAGTIVKLSLGGDPANDIEFDGTTLSTVDDGVAGTTGEQNTAADFQDFLSSTPDILSSTASVTISGVTAVGPAGVFPGPPAPAVLVIQNFTGGTVSLYDAANTLLLSGSLASSSLTGPLGPPGTGALFTTSFGTVTGGTLAPSIVPGSLTLSMNLTDVNGGAGFSLSLPGPPALAPFTADASVNLGGEVPEPAALAILLVGAALLSFGSRRR
jgi:hypothetical protein